MPVDARIFIHVFRPPCPGIPDMAVVLECYGISGMSWNFPGILLKNDVESLTYNRLIMMFDD